VGAVVDEANEGEEQSADEAVADHLDGGAGHTDLAHRGDSEEHIAHLGDGTIGDQSLEVGLT
jgi:hypothetical protein